MILRSAIELISRPALGRSVIALLSLLFVLATPAQSGFAVRPTKLFLAEPGAVAVLHLENNSSSAHVYQVGVAEWLDRADATSVRATSDIIVSPQVFRLGPYETGQVTLRPARGGIAQSGKAYRVLARQVSPKSTEGDFSVRFQVQFNVPLFTLPDS